MNNYDLSEVDSQKPQSDNVSPYMTYGGGQILKINGIELKMSRNNSSYKPILHMETKPITEANFTPIEGAKGKVGKIAGGIYLTTDNLKREFLQKLKTIAVALGVESEVNKVKGENFEDVVKRVGDLLKGNYAKYTIFASEYQKEGGKIGITLSLPKFKFVESESADPSTIAIFDKTNQYHYRKITATTAAPAYGSSYNHAIGGSDNFSSKYGNYDDHVPSAEDSDMPF